MGSFKTFIIIIGMSCLHSEHIRLPYISILFAVGIFYYSDGRNGRCRETESVDGLSGWVAGRERNGGLELLGRILGLVDLHEPASD